MTELSTTLKIGIITVADQLQLDLKLNLNKLGYRDLIVYTNPMETPLLLFNDNIQFLFIDYFFDGQITDHIIADCYFPHKNRAGIPVLPMTREHLLNEKDLTFFKLFGMDQVLATPFTLKSLSQKVFRTFQKHHTKGKKGPVAQVVQQVRQQIRGNDFESATALIGNLKSIIPAQTIYSELSMRIDFLSKEREKAFETAQYLLEKRPNCIYTKVRVASIFNDYGEYNPALDLLKEMDTKAFPLCSINEIRGEAYFHMDQKDLALNDFSQYIRICPNNVNILNKMAVIYKENEDYPMAIKLYSTISTIDPSNYKIQFNLALLFLDSGEKDKAVKILDKIVKTHPEYEKAKNKLSQIT